MNRFLFVILVGLGLAACEILGAQTVNTVLRDLSPSEQKAVAADNRFGFTLFKAVDAETPDENVFVSPLSVSLALGMTLNGASGETRTQMEAVLEKSGLSEAEINAAYRDLTELLVSLDAEVVFEIANSIWYRQGFDVEPAFLEVNREYFEAEVRELDFSDPASVEIVNDWVKEHTREKIEKIVDVIPANVVMYLINAIYFKGDWTHQFDEAETREAEFHNADGTTSTVQMMHRDDPQVQLPVYWTETFQALDLPYGDSLYSMTILLPHPDHTVAEVVASLDAASWTELTNSLQPQKVVIDLPRFKLEYNNSLNDVLSAMGMPVAFTGNANFSRLTPGGGVYISEVRHKTVIEVNEEGTEAAAVTSVAIAESAPLPFRVDRPFVFVIRERHSGSIAFVGRVLSL